MPFIRPTKRGWILLLTGLVWFQIALVNHMLFPFLFACCLLALVVLGFCSSLLSLGRVSISRGAVGDAATGQAVSMPLLIENRSWRRRQPVVIAEVCPFSTEEPHRTVVEPLAKNEKRLVKRRILAMKRGEFDLDRIILLSGDPAGLFVRERRFHCPKRILIFPGIEAIAELSLQPRQTLAAVAGTPISAAGTSQEFYGVREYNPSDGLRYIHWKSSARYGKLMVREFERNATMSVAVLLDAYEHFVSGSEHWSNLEYQIRAAASICDHVSGLYCQFAFGCGGSQSLVLAPRLAAEIRVDVLYNLAVLKPGRVSLAEVAYELGATLPKNTVVFCLSLATPRPLAEALDVLVQQGMTVRWYCARREAFDAQNQKQRRHLRHASFGDLSVDAEHLHPGMRLGRVLAHRG